MYGTSFTKLSHKIRHYSFLHKSSNSYDNIKIVLNKYYKDSRILFSAQIEQETSHCTVNYPEML